MIHKNTAFFLAALFVVFLFLPKIIPSYYVYFIASVLVMALLAMSLNLVVGFGGLFQFHHGVFYGVGAYAIALLVKKTPIPEWICFILSPFVAALAGLIIGLICIRLSKLYFAMIQISLGSLLWALAFRWYGFTGGDDGIHGIPMPSMISGVNNSYYFILIVFVVCIVALFMILKSPFGSTLQAARDNEQRCEAIGVFVKRHQLFAIVIASFFAGIAGVLFVVLERSVFPDLLFWTLSLEILIMCLLGGWFTFAGPIIGAAIMLSLRTFIGIQTEYWTLILAVILALLIFFLPEGVWGYFQEKLKHRKEAVTERGQ
ncbi:MAG: branched-chain amino acid ABC transporter permease [Deltaproteobacteria bacterium]|nr:branched-chain amino acid ABC transporter permease [Deltaproteobacteria bacterium]